MNAKRILALGLGVMAGYLGSPLYALDYLGRIGIGGSYGKAYPTQPDTFKDNTDDGSIWSGNIKIGIADDTVLVASYGNITVEDQTTNRDLLLRPIILSLRYYAFHHSPINPYITAGAGISRNKRDLPVEDQKFNKFAAQGGLGIEFFITPTASIGAEGLYHHFVATSDESPLRFLTAAGTVNFYFGTPESTKQAKEEAERTKRELEQARAEQERLRQEGAASAAAASSSQQSAEQARQEAERQAQAAQTAQKQLSEADMAKTEAERQAQQMQAQTQAAQAELESIKEMISRKEIEPIKFATASDKLLVESYPSLDRVSEVIKKYPSLRLRVEGHTDSVGDDAANLKLSQKRADSVRNYLVTKAGAEGAQIEAVGLGETKPVASNNTAEGRAQNRRVEFLFVQ